MDGRVLSTGSVGIVFLVAALLLGARADAVALAFGPKEYGRTPGAPNSFSDAFSVCATAYPFRLRIENGPGESAPVSSASVTVNGAEVVREADLNQQVRLLERPVRLQLENRLAVRLAGKPGGAIVVTVLGDPGCLSITVLDPVAGAVVRSGLAIVRGTVEGPAEMGVAINGFPALVEGPRFVGTAFVEPGLAAIRAVAATADGRWVEAYQPVVVVSGVEDMIRLRASPQAGLAPLAVGFSVSSLIGLTAVALDSHGTGSPDFGGTTVDGHTAVFARPGLYLPSVEAVDIDGQTHRASTVVHVYDPVALDTRLQTVWQGLKDALRLGDVSRALGFVHSHVRSEYEELWRQFPRSFWANIDRYMTSVQFVEAGLGGAQYEMLRERDDQMLSFAVWFQLDHDGLWRLKRF